MTIDEAIKYLTVLYEERAGHVNFNEWEALKLGIAALKWVKTERKGYELYAPDLLPGETKEGI